MSVRRICALLGVSALMGTASIAGAAAASADDHDDDLRTRSLATVLAKDGGGFDRNPWDYDILDNAVHAVLAAKPSSPVARCKSSIATASTCSPGSTAAQPCSYT